MKTAESQPALSDNRPMRKRVAAGCALVPILAWTLAPRTGGLIAMSWETTRVFSPVVALR